MTVNKELHLRSDFDRMQGKRGFIACKIEVKGGKNRLEW